MQPVYYKFRYTLGDEPRESYTDAEISEFDHILKHTVFRISEYFMDLSNSPQLTSGIEFRNKSGGLAKPHIHIHFRSTCKRDTIARNLQNFYLSKWRIELVGPKVYHLKPEVYITGDRIFRYPLKQGLGEYQIGFTLEELKVMHRIANEEWKMSCEINSNKREKAEAQSTLYDRLIRYLEPMKERGGVQHFANREAVCSYVIDFYAAEGKPINRTTILGYTERVMLHFGTIDSSDLARNFLR